MLQYLETILGLFNDAVTATLLRKNESDGLPFTSPHGVISTYIWILNGIGLSEVKYLCVW
jgi:hypothetical protein